ncbi:MAG: FtsH protease activity modulator HflK [Proteobacteria bacterium]|nr:FtsH protease activity modulator HflK [Pseudomonadota bacterium]
MPWNEPGSGGDNSGGGRKPNGRSAGRAGDTPDLEDVIQSVRKRFGGSGGGSGHSGGDSIFPGWPIVIGLLVVAWLFNSVYIVDEGYNSVELRFGKHTGTYGAGLNMVFWPIEEKRIIDVDSVRPLTVGYRENDASQKQSVRGEAQMVTTDENIVDVELTVQYNIKSAEDLVFNVAEVEFRGGVDAVVRGSTESALREVVGSKTMDGVLTDERTAVEIETRTLLQEILDRYQTGVNVLSVELQASRAPQEVQHAFDDVVKADQDYVRLKNEAEAYGLSVVQIAEGRAKRIEQEANAYRETVVAKAEGEASRFEQVLTEYQKAPAVTRERLYIDTMEQVLANTSKVMIDQQSGGNSLMYLPLDKLVENSGRNTPSAPARSNTTNIVPTVDQNTVVGRPERGREIR